MLTESPVLSSAVADVQALSGCSVSAEDLSATPAALPVLVEIVTSDSDPGLPGVPITALSR